MAVVVQALVPAQAAAVAFTRHPVTGRADHVLINAVPGLGEEMVAGTVTPDTIRALEGDVRSTGAGILDSPVSGSVTTAQSGQLTLMVGGTAADLETARPALEPLAKTIVHVGPLGAGAAMKLAVNTVIFGLNEALAEGLVLAEAAGVDRSMAYDVIAASAVGAPYVGYKRAAFVEPETTPVAFSLDLAAKDLGLIHELAERVGLELPQAETNLDAIRTTAGTIGGDADFSAVATQLRNDRKGATPQSAGGR
jgi:3-hydroxyisobutyrate dehydrogenase/2-hydroxy-3-oxopropionate reductase